MSKTMTASLPLLRFPSACVVCLSPAAKHFKLEQMVTIGRRSYNIKLDIPMCDPHLKAANYKSPVELFMGKFAVYGGVFGGLVSAVILFLRWQGDTGIIFKLFGSSIFAFGAFIIIWWFISASIAPLFAARDSKEARNAVRIIGYWPNDQVVKLSFENEKLVEMIGKEN